MRQTILDIFLRNGCSFASKYSNSKTNGYSTLVVEQVIHKTMDGRRWVQIYRTTLRARVVNGRNSMSPLVNWSSESLDMRSIWDFKFLRAPPYMSITVYGPRI